MYLSKFVGIWVQKIMHIMWHDKTSLITKHPLIMTEYISNEPTPNYLDNVSNDNAVDDCPE